MLSETDMTSVFKPEGSADGSSFISPQKTQLISVTAAITLHIFMYKVGMQQ